VVARIASAVGAIPPLCGATSAAKFNAKTELPAPWIRREKMHTG
jgi:hypothetical protein